MKKVFPWLHVVYLRQTGARPGTLKIHWLRQIGTREREIGVSITPFWHKKRPLHYAILAQPNEAAFLFGDAAFSVTHARLRHFFIPLKCESARSYSDIIMSP